jgi:hypothetical protein
MDIKRIVFLYLGMCNIPFDIRCPVDKDLSMCMTSIIKIHIIFRAKTHSKTMCLRHCYYKHCAKVYGTRKVVKLSHPSLNVHNVSKLS